MATPTRKGRLARETQAVLNPFLDILRSSADITIPDPTLQGAISHFLSILHDDPLESFVQDVLSSPSLWRTLSPQAVQECARSAVSSRVTSLRPTFEDKWLAQRKLDKAAGSWLSTAVKAVQKSSATFNGLYVMVGLLQGADDVQGVDWGNARTVLEEDIVIAVSDGLAGTRVRADEVLDVYCTAASCVDAARLRALDLKTIVLRLHIALFEALGFPVPESFPAAQPVDTAHVASLARGLSRSIAVLATGSASNQEAWWDAAVSFVARMHDCATKLGRQWDGANKPEVGGNEWERQKAAVLAFTAVSWPIVETLLQPPDGLRHVEASDLAALIIDTLSKFSPLVDVVDGGVEGYEKVLFGSLDVVAGKGPRAVHRLLRKLRGHRHEVVSDSLAGFILVVCEQLIHLVDAPAVRDVALPLATKHYDKPQSRPSFEAAHAFLLALLEAASRTVEFDPKADQGAFVDHLALVCAQGLVREAKDGSVRAEQLRAAYPGVIRAASRRSPALVHKVMAILDTATFTTDEEQYVQAVRVSRIAAAAYLSAHEVKPYLENVVAPLILATPEGEERLELAALAFKTVMEDMPDGTKQTAVEWWLRWRRRFDADKAGRARL